MLVYLPASREHLRALRDHGEAELPRGWIVTDALRALDQSLSDEDWEYHATHSAADAAADLPGAEASVVVIVADIEGGDLAARDEPEIGRVSVTAPVARDRVEAVFLGEQRGDEYDLSWYVRQEIESLLKG